MNDCIFCKIVNGEIPSYTIYEDDLVKVFLDINPVTNGHALIIPKKHCKNFLDIDKELLLHFNKIKKELYSLLKEKLSCKGVTFVQNNDLGQDVKHFHIHVMPRYDEDSLEIITNKDNSKDVKEVYDTIKNN